MKEITLFILVILPFALLYLGTLLRNHPANSPGGLHYDSINEQRKRHTFWAITTFITVIFTCLLITFLFMIAIGKI